MATPRSVRRPVGRPQLVQHAEVAPRLSVNQQIAAAQRRLEETGQGDQVRRFAAAVTEPNELTQVLANQEEILRRLSAGESALAKVSEKVQSISDHLDVLADDGTSIVEFADGVRIEVAAPQVEAEIDGAGDEEPSED